MKIFPKDNSSNSTNNTDTHDTGNSFGERDKAQANKRRNNNKWRLSQKVRPSSLSTIQGVTSSNSIKNDSIKIDSLHLKNALNDKTFFSTCELDQHADTCCLGSNFYFNVWHR